MGCWLSLCDTGADNEVAEIKKPLAKYDYSARESIERPLIPSYSGNDLNYNARAVSQRQQQSYNGSSWPNTLKDQNARVIASTASLHENKRHAPIHQNNQAVQDTPLEVSEDQPLDDSIVYDLDLTQVSTTAVPAPSLYVNIIGGVPVRKTDLQRLEEGVFLNDSIVNAYSEYLKREFLHNGGNPNTYYFFQTFFYTGLADKGYKFVKEWLSEKDYLHAQYLIIPINVSNIHWKLAVVDLASFQIQIYDSMSANAQKEAKKIQKCFNKELGVSAQTRWSICSMATPKQMNGYDCGVFLLKYLECILSNSPFDFTQADITSYRKHISQILSTYQSDE